MTVKAWNAVLEWKSAGLLQPLQAPKNVSTILATQLFLGVLFSKVWLGGGKEDGFAKLLLMLEINIVLNETFMYF